MVALGDFDGNTGLSRAAVYEFSRLKAEYPKIEALSLSELRPLVEAGKVLDGPPIGTLILLCQPENLATLMRAFPPERVAESRRIGLWVWETPIFPADWRFALDVVHEIWTPSEFSRSVIAPAVAPIPVKLRPHNVTRPAEIVPFDRAAYGVPEDGFFGLSILDLTACPARKNPWAHVAAWQAAFGDDPQRHLIMKLRVSNRTRCVIDELTEMIAGARNIRLLERELSSAEIAGLQSAADVFLSLHRAEGYGLNIRECLEAGVPVLATDFSANAEYGPAFANYHPLPYRPTRYRDWTGHYPDARFQWAEVEIVAAADELKRQAARWAVASALPRPATAAGGRG